MKLFELAGVKKYADETLAKILNRFIEKKQLKVRSGGFAFVIIPENKDYVFKVWLKDPGFETYLKYVQAHSGDKHLPKLIGDVRELPIFFKHSEKIEGKMKVLRIEKLEPVKADSAFDHVLSHVIHMLRKLKIGKLNSGDVPELIEKLKITRPVQSAGHSRAIKPEEFNPELEKHVSLIKTMIEVWQNLGANNTEIGEDLIGNIMMRGTTPVIVDPYYTKHQWSMTASDMLNGNER